MEEDKQQVFLDSIKTIPHGIIVNFITQMSLQKPHLQIQNDSLQFYKTKKKDLECNQNWAKYEDGFDRFDDSFANYENMCIKPISISQIDLVKWVYFFAFDKSSNLYKTLKVQFLELFGNKTIQFQKQLMSQKRKITLFHDETSTYNQEERNLILKIYDYYFLSIADESTPLYFVVEQEYVHSAYQKYSRKILNWQNDIIQQQHRHLQFLQKWMGFKISLNLLSPLACYYLVFNDDDSLSLRLSPLDFYPLFSKLNSDSRMITEEQPNNQRPDQSQEDTMLSKMQCDSIETIQLDLNSNWDSMNGTLINTLKRNNPNVFALHDNELLEILSLHPSFKNSELEVYNKNIIQFKNNIIGGVFLLSCVKYESHFEAERIKNYFGQLLTFGFFHPESACEIIPLSRSITYLLFIELDFALNTFQKLLNVDYQYYQNTKKTYELFYWLICKFEINQQNSIKIPISLDYNIVELTSENSNTPTIYFKELFTFQHIYKFQSKCLMGRYSKISNRFEEIWDQQLYYSQISEGSKHKLGESLYLYLEQEYDERKQINCFPPLLKAFQVVSKFREIDLKYNNICDVNLQTFKIFLKEMSHISKNNFNPFSLTMKLIFALLQMFDQPTQVKTIIIRDITAELSQSLEKFSFVFANLEELEITVNISELLEMIYLLQIQKLTRLTKVTIKQSCTTKSDDQKIQMQEAIFVNNFIEVCKMKTLKCFDVDLKLLFPLIHPNKSLLTFNQTYRMNEISQQSKTISINEQNENQQYTFNNIISLMNYYSPSNQIQKIKEELPFLSFEIQQNYCLVDSKIITSINIYSFEDNEKNILLTIHFNNNQSNSKQTYNSDKIISYETKHQKRLTSKCFLIELKSDNLYEIIKECVFYESYINKMKMWYKYKVQSNCQHHDFNEFMIQFQTNFQVLNIDLKLCQQTIELMNSNSNYLGLQSSKFHQLFQININFPNNEMTQEAIQGLSNNIRKCKRAYQIKISCSEQQFYQPKRNFISFLNTPHLIKFEFVNRAQSYQNFNL